MNLKEIINQFNNGDKNALKSLYENVAKKIYVYGYSITKNTFDAEKVLKNTMVEISNTAYSYIEKENPMVWIMSIARKIAFEINKNDNGLNGINSQEYLEIISDNKDVTTPEMYKILNEYSLEKRQILVLKRYIELSDKEISTVTGFSGALIRENIEEEENLQSLDKLKIPEVSDIIVLCSEPDVDSYKNKRNKEKKNKIAITVSCVLIALICIVVLPIFLIQQVKYIEAKKYFSENQLVFDGFSKNDVIDVYKDIDGDRFSLEITEEVINTSIKQAGNMGRVILMPGKANSKEKFELLQKEDDYEESNVRYDNREGMRKNNSYNSIFERYVDDKLQWSVSFSKFSISNNGGYMLWYDYILVYGQTDRLYEYSAYDTYIALLDSDGNKMWTKKIDSEYPIDLVDIVLSEDTISVFVINTNNNIECKQFDKDGNVVADVIDFQFGLNLNIAAKWKEGYALVLFDKNENLHLKYTTVFGIEKDDWIIDIPKSKNLVINSMVEHNGKLYFAGYIENNLVVDDDDNDNEVLTQACRRKYCSKLWVLDEQKQSLEEVYSIQGVKSIDIYEKDEKLQWDILKINQYEYLGKSAATYKGESEKFNIILDIDNGEVNQIKTGEVKVFEEK